MTEIKDKETGLTLAETIEKFREEVRKVDAENPDQRPAADMDWVAQTVTFPFELKVCSKTHFFKTKNLLLLSNTFVLW